MARPASYTYVNSGADARDAALTICLQASSVSTDPRKPPAFPVVPHQSISTRLVCPSLWRGHRCSIVARIGLCHGVWRHSDSEVREDGQQVKVEQSMHVRPQQEPVTDPIRVIASLRRDVGGLEQTWNCGLRDRTPPFIRTEESRPELPRPRRITTLAGMMALI